MNETTHNNKEVNMEMMGQTIALVTPLSRQLVRQFRLTSAVPADMRNEIRAFLKLRKLTVANTASLNWNPNS